MLRRLWLKLFLYCKGIKFYKTHTIPKSPEFKKAEFRTVGNHLIEFFFYKEICEDLIFKRGKIKKQKFIGYVIQARFDESLPKNLQRYNNLKFFFSSRRIRFTNEDDIVKALLNIYLDFIRSELESDWLEDQEAE